ncbi:MAG TPA: PAAR domain-containing protein [Methylococcales bacterium]|jgi:uncharacterized Zn-binding protein involved in type VI secretion
MAGRPAARVGDITAHGSPLSIGPGSFNVIIGGQLAWRGISAAQAALLAKTVAEGAEKIAKAQAAATLAAGTPAAAAAQANVVKTITDAAKDVAGVIAGFVPADIHTCPIVKLVIPDGVGVVIDGSQTVLINNLAACRLGDTIQETTSVNKIVQGLPTVLIGG